MIGIPASHPLIVGVKHNSDPLTHVASFHASQLQDSHQFFIVHQLHGSFNMFQHVSNLDCGPQSEHIHQRNYRETCGWNFRWTQVARLVLSFESQLQDGLVSDVQVPIVCFPNEGTTKTSAPKNQNFGRTFMMTDA